MDNISINKIIFISTTDRNRYLQLIFRNKKVLTRVGAREAPNIHPILNFISALLIFNGEASLIMEVEFTTIIPMAMPSII